MIDVIKDYLTPKRFGVVAYICLIVHFLCGLVFTAVTSSLRAGEFGKFSCTVDTGSTILYKIYVEKTCYSRYEQAYNSPLPLYGFVLLSTGIVVLVSVIYSLGVSSRVDEIDRSSSGSEEPATDGGETNHGFHVFYFYFLHLVVRSIFGILFSVLQYTVFYPNGFDFQFSCTLPNSDVTQIGNKTSMGKFNYTTTSIACENSSASEKRLWSMIVCVLNTAFALVVLCEVIYLSQRLPILDCCSVVGWSSDTHFITVYFLRKRYVQVEDEVALTSMDDNTPPVHSTPDTSIAGSSLQDSIDIYKHQVLDAPLTSDICYAPKVDLDHLYIDVVIHTGRARHDFSKEMARHEIFHVYMKVPESSIRLEEIKDLFYPNKDTYGQTPRTILAVGRPGIGKTVLTQKIHHDWANGVDEFYRGKIAFFFKFRWFNFEELNNLLLKTFLRYGTGLSEEKFESIFEEILKEPQKALFIFDGFDEFSGDLSNCFEQSRILPNDPTTCTSAINLFLKLTCGNLLKGATVVVTSRPTAEHFYSRLNFKRSVEIIGFTLDKIEEYVSRFCENNGRSDLKPKIWDHITASSDLLNLCYIPVNCFIVCVTMTNCLSDPRNDTGALPTTLTELYSTAINHFAMHHNRNLDETSLEQIHKDLQNLAFRGMENGQLIFNKQLFDAQMKRSGLVNSLSNPIFPLQMQFCFIHLTIQEFLAARHVTETLAPNEIEKFISTHFESAKWHLVLQFIAGLLGEKTKMSANDYDDCIMTFAKSFALQTDKTINLNNVGHMLVMKCLREVDDEDIAKQACEKTDLNLVTRIYGGCSGTTSLSTSDWAAVTFVSKHLKNLKDLFLQNVIKKDNHFLDLGKLVKQRCLESLALDNNGDPCSDYAKKRLFDSLRNSKCTLSHEHAKLSTLHLSIDVQDEYMSNLCAFIKNGNAIYLQQLDLSNNYFTSCGISQLCDVLNDDHCKELRYLNFSTNYELDDEGLGMLCNTIRGHCTLVNTLIFDHCILGAAGVSLLCQLLCDEQCKLNVLSLEGHYILGDKVVRMLCTDALRKEECQLTDLGLGLSNLTDECIPLLCETLQDRNCKLTKLSLGGNLFTEEGKTKLRDVAKTEACKARVVY